jgi:hypothetical protein
VGPDTHRADSFSANAIVAVQGASGVVVQDGAAVRRLDLDHLPQVVPRLLLDRLVVIDTGVVDRNVDPAVPTRELGEVLPVTQFGDVAGERFDPAAALLRRSVEEVAAALVVWAGPRRA